MQELSIHIMKIHLEKTRNRIHLFTEMKELREEKVVHREIPEKCKSSNKISMGVTKIGRKEIFYS